MDNNLNADYKPPKKKDTKKEILSWVRSLGGAVAIAGLIIMFVAQFVTVKGQSMEPTFHDGNKALIYKLDKNYKKGDVVVIHHVLDEPIIKRVIATEGQVVDFNETLREVTVDGEPVYGREFGIDDGQTFVENMTGQILDFPQTVPEGHVFVLGDNRMHSTDSRFRDVGMVPVEKIMGKVVIEIFPEIKTDFK